MKKETISNLTFTALAILLLFLCLTSVGRHYFDLNDDVLIKDILSGSYLGKPDGHTIQMLYPLCSVLASLYKLSGGLNWFGFFLCALQYFCAGILIYQLISFFDKTLYKALAALIGLLALSGLFATHLLFVQYTFTSGLLASTAASLILLHRKKDFRLILSAILIWISYLLRTEMLFLLSPFLCAALCFRFFAGFPFGQKKAFFTYAKEYLLFLGGLLSGMLILYLIHFFAYSSPEWQDFLFFDDRRTELYDFQSIPSYEENEAIYASLNLQKSEEVLLENYNYGLDEKINGSVMEKLAAYSALKKKAAIPFSRRLADTVSLYLYRLRHFSAQGSYSYPGTDFPWNAFSLLLYLAVFLLFILPKDSQKSQAKPIAIALLCTLAIGRSAVWIFLLLRGRDPIRVTHPLSLVEIVILAFLFLIRRKEVSATENSRKIQVCTIPCCLLVLISVLSLGNQFTLIRQENAARIETNKKYEELYGYFAMHQDSFYLLDVYTSVYYLENGKPSPGTYSQRILQPNSLAATNYDLLGGWACKSPLSDSKIRELGFSSMKDSLLQENVYFVQDSSKSVEWLEQFYASVGIDIQIVKSDEISEVFGIYRLTVK